MRRNERNDGGGRNTEGVYDETYVEFQCKGNQAERLFISFHRQIPLWRVNSEIVSVETWVYTFSIP